MHTSTKSNAGKTRQNDTNIDVFDLIIVFTHIKYQYV
jgi:hypothetical protein